jgi:hypothetical protein
MAVHHRNTPSSNAQEPAPTIARVALYARVSTPNGQDPEMQLSELREYASRRVSCVRLLKQVFLACGWIIAPIVGKLSSYNPVSRREPSVGDDC